MKAATRSASTVAWWWLASRSAPCRLCSSASADANSNARCCLHHVVVTLPAEAMVRDASRHLAVRGRGKPFQAPRTTCSTPE